MPFPSLALLALSLALPLQQADDAEIDLTRITEADAIACRLDVPTYMAFAMAVRGKEGVARQRGWKQIGSDSGFILEYQLPKPISVAGHATRRIGFTGDSILAILDLPDPAVVARAEKIANDVDLEPLIAELVASGKATRAQVEAEFKFRKFLGERILKDETRPAGDEADFGARMVVARTISNATTHPGKTLYGCAYRLEVLDKDGKPL